MMAEEMLKYWYHYYHSQNFDKIDSCLKLVLNVCILCNSLKKGAGILHQISRFRVGVNSCLGREWEGDRIHQGNSLYYLGHFQISKVKQKFPNQMFHRFHEVLAKLDKHFLCSVSKILHLGKQQVIYILIKSKIKNEKMGRWNIKVYKGI